MLNYVQKKVLILALFAGEIMMKSGAEIYRVEDTIIRICKSCGIDYVECFATTTGIFLSIDKGGEENDMHTFIKRIKSTEINLDRISQVNTFSRSFTSSELSIDEGLDQLRKINTEPLFPMIVRLIGAVLIGVFFCPIFGGGITDMIVAGVISGITYLISCGIATMNINSFIRIFISCIAASGMVLAAAELGISDTISPVVVAATTLFLPGVAITNAARDLLSGDMVSGVARVAEASITAVAIAGGVGIGIQLWLLGGGEIGHDTMTLFDTPWFLFFGFFATLGFGIIFNAPKKLLLPAAVIGAVGMYLLQGMTLQYNIIAASFFGTCAIAIMAEIASRAGKDATTIFIIPGIIPFVPGKPLYETMSLMLEGSYTQAISVGTQALIIAGCIAIALVLIATFARLILAVGNHIGSYHSKK